MSCCDICYESKYKTIKCFNQCTFNTCLKCCTKIENCPQCRGGILHIVLMDEIINHFKENRYIRIYEKKKSKAIIFSTMLKEIFEFHLDSFMGDEDLHDSINMLHICVDDYKRCIYEYMDIFGYNGLNILLNNYD